jgi:hypothetical protein
LGAVVAADLLMVVDDLLVSPARPAGNPSLDYVFQNSDKDLCPVTYTYEVDNANSFSDNRAPLFAIDSDTKKVTFDYSNGYDGLTIHYKVKALTAANVPLYVTFSVIGKSQKCRTSTLTWNDASPL